MARAWDPELVVSVALAQSLIESQFPQLAPVRAVPLGAGFDNTAYRVNDQFVFRFPRRQFAVQFLEAEIRILPAIASRLPLAIPNPAFVGGPADGYSWPFAGYPMLYGRTACSAALDESHRVAAAEPLARFLATLHGITSAEAPGAGRDTIGRLDLAIRIPRARTQLEQLAQKGIVANAHDLSAILDAAPAAYRPRKTSLVHGDLYCRHLLVGRDGELVGVIDWGDVHFGDPAVDLAIAYTFLPSAGRAIFREVYGRVDDLTWSIARLRALWHTLAVLAFADDIGDENLLREGKLSLVHLATN